MANETPHAECLKPLSIPDSWNDANADGLFNDGDTYDAAAGYTRDAIGATLVLRPGTPHASIASQRYFVVAFPELGAEQPPQTGGDHVLAALRGCASLAVADGQRFLIEPGNVVAIVREVVDELTRSDASARWDEETKTVIGSRYVRSPRLMTVTAFDPAHPPDSSNNTLVIRKVITLFVEAVRSPSEIETRIVDVRPPSTTAVESELWGWLKNRYRR